MKADYEEALELTRSWLDQRSPSSLSPIGLEAALDTERRRSRRRTGIVMGLFASVLGAWLASIVAHPIVGIVCDWVSPLAIVRYGLVHVLGFGLATWLARSPRPWAQMLVRALWWSALLAGSAGMVTEPGTIPILMPVIVLASAVGLLVVGERGVYDVQPGEGFGLAVHRRSIILMMILAIADTETLLMAALNHDDPVVIRYATIDLGCAAAMGVAMWGLYRLRTWGLVATLALNVVIATLGLAGLLFYEPGFAYLLATTAIIQLGLAAPLVRTLVSGTAPPERRPRRWSHGAISRWVLAAIVIADVWAFARMIDPQVVATYCRLD